jgi:hypothetical protein
MTILALVPAPDFVVLAAERVFVANDVPLAIACGDTRLAHPVSGATADIAEVCSAALAQFPRDRPSSVGEFARGFARACQAMLVAQTTMRAFVGGVAPDEKLAAAFEIVLASGQPPRVTRVFEPFVGSGDNQSPPELLVTARDNRQRDDAPQEPAPAQGRSPRAQAPLGGRRRRERRGSHHARRRHARDVLNIAPLRRRIWTAALLGRIQHQGPPLSAPIGYDARGGP